MNIYCDDGSTNVKLAWFEGDELQTRVSANSFRHGWKVAEFSAATFNYQVGTLKYTWDSVSRDAIPTTNVEYQYGDLNLLAVHHALLNSGLEPQPVSLTVTLPLSEYYDGDCQRNEENIRRKRENLMRELVLNKGRAFTVTDVKVMPESLPAAFSRLADRIPSAIPCRSNMPTSSAACMIACRISTKQLFPSTPMMIWASLSVTPSPRSTPVRAR